MFPLKKLLGSVILCAVLTAPTQASAPDEGTSTNSTTPTWTIETTNAAKIANKDTSLMSLPIWPLQQLSQIFVENGCPEAILALGLTSSHLTGSILGWNYPDPCQDEDTRINNPTIQQAIRVDLRKAINAREAHIHSQTPKAKQKKDPLLAPWRELLGENASLHHLIWALQMLRPQNVERLGWEGLLEQLTSLKDKAKALALGASAAQIFTDKMDEFDQLWIIKGALASSRPLSEYEALSAACKNLSTKDLSGYFQSMIIQVALASSRPLSEYATRSAACKQHLFTEKMDRYDQAWIISSILPLSDAQLAQLVRECATRPHDDASRRKEFIEARVKELREGK